MEEDKEALALDPESVRKDARKRSQRTKTARRMKRTGPRHGAALILMDSFYDS